MDRLMPLRGPLATVALAALTLVALARVLLGVSELVGSGGSTAVAAARLAPNGGDGALTVLVVLLVASCHVPPAVPNRRALALWGVALAVVSLLATAAALSLTDLAIAGWTVVWIVPDLAVPALVGVGLLALARHDAAASAPPPVLEQPVLEEPGEELVEEPVDEPHPEQQPSWTTDAAAGAVWRTAGDAARGAPALDWRPAGEGSWPLPAPSLPAGPSAEDGDQDRSRTDRS